MTTKPLNPIELDPGHYYRIPRLDGYGFQSLRFVKRCDYNDPTRFPGNTNAYPGATSQQILRILLSRMEYLQNQIPCAENVIIIENLQNCLYFFEARACRRHGITVDFNKDDASTAPMCRKCGHIKCNCIGDNKCEY